MTEDQIIEQVARGIAEAHFAGKRYPHWFGPKEMTEAIAYRVDRHWRTYVPHACNAIVAVRNVLRAVKQ